MEDTIVKSSWNGVEGKLGGRDIEFLEISGGYLSPTSAFKGSTRGSGSILDRETESAIGGRYTVNTIKKLDKEKQTMLDGCAGGFVCAIRLTRPLVIDYLSQLVRRELTWILVTW